MTAGYEAYSYLDQSPWPGPLAPEFGRVPGYDSGLAPEAAPGRSDCSRRTSRSACTSTRCAFPRIWPTRLPNNRTGRQHSAYAGLQAAGLTAVFDNMMDGTAWVTGTAPWQWEDVVTDLGLRQADVAQQSDVVVIPTLDDIATAHRDGTVGSAESVFMLT
jgi:membrane dipeptidase